MKLILNMNINTEIEINSVKDLNKLKIIVEVNNLEKPNFSELARQLGVDRRTAKKHYEGNLEKERKDKKSKIDDYHDISLLCYQQKISRYSTINLICTDI